MSHRSRCAVLGGSLSPVSLCVCESIKKQSRQPFLPHVVNTSATSVNSVDAKAKAHSHPYSRSRSQQKRIRFTLAITHCTRSSSRCLTSCYEQWCSCFATFATKDVQCSHAVDRVGFRSVSVAPDLLGRADSAYKRGCDTGQQRTNHFVFHANGNTQRFSAQLSSGVSAGRLCEQRVIRVADWAWFLHCWLFCLESI